MVVLAAAAASGAAAAPLSPAGRAGARLPSATGLPALYWSGAAWLPTMEGCNTNKVCFRGLPDTVFVDAAGRLHLRIVDSGGSWMAAQVSSVEEDFGYGTYRWVLDTPLASLDPASVVGLYTYNGFKDVTAAKGDDHVGHLEADFELTRWRNGASRNNVQETIQPYYNPHNFRRLAVPAHRPGLAFELTWAPTGTTFVIRSGASTTAPVLKRWWTPAPIGQPRLGTRVNLNFWNYGGPPLSGQPQEVVIDSFSYTPGG